LLIAGLDYTSSYPLGELVMTDDPTTNVTFTNPPALASPPGYSHVVEIRSGRLIYIAGQTALDENGQLVGGQDFEAQADQVFRNLSAALLSAGCTARNLVKLTVFVRDMGKLPYYRKARDRFFNTATPPAAPAITLVEVSKLFGDEFLIEIEAVAAA
jgi:enamine deaminase RidA (YjgF/YER057c/UK114 family)